MLESLMSNQPFEYKKLPREEMESRGILGRLIGVIADYTNPTRNGRLYREDLWDRVFDDPIMQERIDNRCCFGELGHPADREETDMSKIAICLAEKPVKKDGKLYGVFDILNNANGQILKTLCDYGCNIGISSRGSGDLETDFDGNESVNPETYHCEGWDAVLIPAVKDARLQYVTESLNKTRYNKTLKDKLVESLEKETADNRKVMKESLNALGIKLDESKDRDYARYESIIKSLRYDFDLPQVEIHPNGTLVEFDFGDYAIEIDTYKEDVANTLYNYVSSRYPRNDDEYLDDEDLDESLGSGDQGKLNTYILKYVWKALSDYASQYMNDNEDFSYEELNKALEIAKSKVCDKYSTRARELGEDYEPDFFDRLHNRDISQETDGIDAQYDEIDTVDDDKVDIEMVEQIQTLLKQNSKMQEQIIELQEKLSVCYAKETKFNEELNNKKLTIKKLSSDARRIRPLEEKINSLQSELNNQTTKYEKNSHEVKVLNENIRAGVQKSKSLSESLKMKDDEISTLKESISQLNRDNAELEKAFSIEREELNERFEDFKKDFKAKQTQYSEKLNKSNKLVEKYKNIATSAVNKYIDSQALKLGVSSNEIKNRLPESYNFDDIDEICEDLRSYKLTMSRLPFTNENMKINVKSNKEPLVESMNNISNTVDDTDMVDDMLLSLAKI